jgi:hypothetical protein
LGRAICFAAGRKEERHRLAAVVRDAHKARWRGAKEP